MFIIRPVICLGLAYSLAPRAFEDIFRVVKANEKKFKFTITCYMIELYCDKLIDLFAPKVYIRLRLSTLVFSLLLFILSFLSLQGKANEEDEKKLKVRKNQRGLTYVEGAETKAASSAEELYALFESGSASR